MTSRIIERPEIVVLGIAARTNNRREMTAEGQIGPLWGRFMAEQVAASIPNRAQSGELISVYSDYESDASGDYTVTVGCAVENHPGPPEGMVAVTIPAGRYIVLTSRLGPVQEVVPELWGEIWKASQAEMGGRRAFTTDFEVHPKSDPQDTQVEIFLAIAEE